MAKYRRKSALVEAWQAGAGEPKPGWVRFVPDDGWWVIKANSKVDILHPDIFAERYDAA